MTKRLFLKQKNKAHFVKKMVNQKTHLSLYCISDVLYIFLSISNKPQFGNIFLGWNLAEYF